MKQANAAHLRFLLGPFAGGVDDDELMDKYGDLNTDDPGAVEDLVKAVIAPYFLTYDDASRYKVKCSLAYFLSSGSIDFVGVMQSVLVPFQPPSDGRGFFMVIWAGLFD